MAVTSNWQYDSYSEPVTLQHTIGHVDCPVCEQARQLAVSPSELASLPFLQAGYIWLDARVGLAPKSAGMYRCYLKALDRFFGHLKLSEIHIGHVQEYQRMRRAGQIAGMRAGGAKLVNLELNCLKQIMSRAGVWAAEIADWYEPLAQQPSKIGVALSVEDERRLFRVASERPRWFVAYCCSLITANTTAGPGEIRNLTLQDVSLDRRTIYIREGAKNKYRVRELPLNDDAFWAVRQLLARAWGKGSIYPHHYLLPHRPETRGGEYDPLRPMHGWRKAWEALRVAAALPRLRMYDLRHHAITKLLENPNISEKTVEDLAGHVSERMKDTYSHIRTEAKRSAVDMIGTSFCADKPIGPRVVAPKSAAGD